MAWILEHDILLEYEGLICHTTREKEHIHPELQMSSSGTQIHHQCGSSQQDPG